MMSVRYGVVFMSLRFIPMIVLLGMSMMAPSSAHAVCSLNQTLPYHYPAQRMDETLQDFAHRSGCFVQISPDAMRDHQTASIRGRYRPLTALRRLIRHIPNLRAESTEEGLLVREIRHRT